MKKINLIIIIITFLNINLSCKSDDDSFEENNTFSFIGIVLDDENFPIENSLVKLGDISKITDVNGQFEFNNIEFETNYAFIIARKEGYINGLRTIADLQTNNNIRVALLKDNLATIMGTGGNSVTQFPSGLTFKIDGFISKVDGSPFTGFMYPVIHHISTNNPYIRDLAPGFNPTDVITYGYVYVKLEDSEKNRLDIAIGHNAILEFKIEDIDIESAPNEVNLLNLDKSTGLWGVYGTALRENILGEWVYKAEVSSFENPWFKLSVIE